MATRTLGYNMGITLGFNGKQALSGLAKTKRSFLSLKRIVTGVIAGKMVRDMAQFGRDFGLMADRTGMSVQKLSGLRNAFISAGSGAKGFERTINNINDSLQGLALGNGEGAARLAMFGVTPYTSGGRIKEPDEILYGLADWAKRQKGRLSKEQILYRFRTLLNIDDELGRKLLDGAESFRKFREGASQRMGEIDGNTQKRLDNIKTKWDELGGTISNTTAKIVADLDKPLGKMLDWSREIVKTAGDYPKVGAAVIGGVTLTSVIAGLSSAFGGASLLVAGLTAALSGLALTIGGFIGYLGAKLLDPLWEKIGNLLSFTYGKKDELAPFKVNGKLDYDSLEYWFSTGSINPYKNKDQYQQALSMLYAYKPDKYQNLYADMMTNPDFRGEEEEDSWWKKAIKFGFPIAGLNSFYYDIAKAMFSGDNKVSPEIKQDFAFYVSGNMNEETAKETVQMMSTALDAKPAMT